MAFKLPEFVEWDSKFLSEIVPLQVLRVIMDQVLSQLMPSEGGGKRVKVLSVGESEPWVVPAADRHWLPSMERWLPGSWACTPIADKAVKEDGADINFAPWHARIQLVLPWCRGRQIACLEIACLRRWRRNLMWSFTHYLKSVYGVGWMQRLETCRRQVSRRTRKGVALSAGTGKRRRMADGQLNKGGEERERGEEGGEMGEEGDRGGVYGLSVSDKELLVDASKGTAVLTQAMESAWWEWTRGSSLFFWRWNGRDQVRAARDGMEIFVAGPLPKERKSKTTLRFSATELTLVASKLDVMVQRSYLEEGYVESKVHFFGVPKGLTDIRVVFDGTSSGLNEALWAPNFYLPTAKAAASILTFTTWMADADFGEMFHNFPMPDRIRRFAGVEIGAMSALMSTPLAVGKQGQCLARWSRLFMGMRPSPYNAVRYYYWGEEFIRGDPGEATNAMRYDKIVFNLPSMETYDPRLPKVMKWNDQIGAVAGDFVTFVDDCRITGSSKEHCHEVHRQFASRVQYLGMQDVPRKFRPPSQTQAGAWTGTIFRIDSQAITKSVSQEK